jgi:ubiquinone/menaquinone biosynthesis C-methylase UbiE
MEVQTETIPLDPCMKARAKHQFEQWSDTYDRSLLNLFLFRPGYIVAMEEVARWRAANRERTPFRLLDVGCATGTFASLLAGSPWPVEVLGLDYSAAMCSSAAEKLRGHRSPRNVRFLNADSEHIPLADASVDVITCSNSFHHYPHQQAVVREMSRVLAPGGRLIIIDGFRDCVLGWAVFDVIINRVERDVHHAPWPLMRDYFDAAGFRNVRRRHFNFWFPSFATIGDRA